MLKFLMNPDKKFQSILSNGIYNQGSLGFPIWADGYFTDKPCEFIGFPYLLINLFPASRVAFIHELLVLDMFCPDC